MRPGLLIRVRSGHHATVIHVAPPRFGSRRSMLRHPRNRRASRSTTCPTTPWPPTASFHGWGVVAVRWPGARGGGARDGPARARDPGGVGAVRRLHAPARRRRDPVVGGRAGRRGPAAITTAITELTVDHEPVTRRRSQPNFARSTRFRSRRRRQPLQRPISLEAYARSDGAVPLSS